MNLAILLSNAHLIADVMEVSLVHDSTLSPVCFSARSLKPWFITNRLRLEYKEWEQKEEWESKEQHRDLKSSKWKHLLCLRD